MVIKATRQLSRGLRSGVQGTSRDSTSRAFSALLKAGRKTYVFPAFPLETVKDPTGAGDTFAGGFMGYLTSCGGFSDVAQLKRAMLYGTVMASYTVQEFSTKALEDLTRARIDDRFEDLVERLSIPVDPVLIAAN